MLPDHIIQDTESANAAGMWRKLKRGCRRGLLRDQKSGYEPLSQCS
jgi:hypothetical protein